MFPFKSKVYIVNDSFIKEYSGINKYYQDRITDAAIFMSDSGHGASVYDIKRSKNKLTIIFQKVKPATVEDFNDQFRQKLIELINAFHGADYAHGDLCVSNIGVLDDGRPVLLDPDTVFRISTSHEDPLILEYADKGFGTDDIDWLINWDFDNWQEELADDDQ